MKILAINGSHRGDKGYTRFLIDNLLSGALEEGAICEVVTLAKQKINRCLSCLTCQKPEHRFKCVYEDKDDVNGIFGKMSDADIIVYATPVYIYNMSGLLKTFLDRLYAKGDVLDMCFSRSGLVHHYVDHSICSKPFVTLICCNNLEDRAHESIRTYFKIFSKFMDAPQVGILIRNGGSATGYGKNSEKENRFPKIHSIYEAYVEAGRELALKGKISRKTQRKANQEIVPLPLFKYLKKLTPIKKKIIEIAGEMQ